MNKTTRKEIDVSQRITVNTDTLAACLDCGRATAIQIGESAGAKIMIGRRVLWNLSKVKKYLDGLEVMASE